MAFLTLAQLNTEILTEIGLVTGSAVQTYTDPQIVVAINRMFRFILRKVDWPHLTSTNTYTLDAVNGYVTQDVSTIIDVADIILIRDSVTRRKITRSFDDDHLFITDTTVRLWTPVLYSDANFPKLIRFWPNDAVGSVTIKATHRPTPFVNGTDKVPFDSDIMAIAAAWYLLQGDGLNPGNAAKAKGIFEISFNDYVAQLGTIDHGSAKSYLDGEFTIS